MTIKTIPAPVWFILCTCCLEKCLSSSFFSNRITVPSRLAKISLHPSPLTLAMLTSAQPQNTICQDLKHSMLLKRRRCCNTLQHRIPDDLKQQLLERYFGGRFFCLFLSCNKNDVLRGT